MIRVNDPMAEDTQRELNRIRDWITQYTEFGMNNPNSVYSSSTNSVKLWGDLIVNRWENDIREREASKSTKKAKEQQRLPFTGDMYTYIAKKLQKGYPAEIRFQYNDPGAEMSWFDKILESSECKLDFSQRRPVKECAFVDKGNLWSNEYRLAWNENGDVMNLFYKDSALEYNLL